MNVELSREDVALLLEGTKKLREQSVVWTILPFLVPCAIDRVEFKLRNALRLARKRKPRSKSQRKGRASSCPSKPEEA